MHFEGTAKSFMSHLIRQKKKEVLFEEGVQEGTSRTIRQVQAHKKNPETHTHRLLYCRAGNIWAGGEVIRTLAVIINGTYKLP